MSGFKVNFSVNNQLATPAIHAAALANRPAAGQPGRVFIDTDNPSTGIYRDTGTAWIQIAATSSPETDTLQTVTNRGNTTTQNVTIGAGTIPVGTIDARKATAALNNSSDRAIIAQSTPTIPNGASFGVHNVSVVEGGLIQDYQGSATIANTGTNAAGIFVNSITFSSATPQTLTVSQAAGIRAIAGTQTGLYFTGSGAGGGTITHVAGLRVVTPINTGGTAINITNNYGLLVSTQTPLTGTINYTNRWGIYQEGANDQNYFASNVAIGTTAPTAGYSLDVNGSVYFRNFNTAAIFGGGSNTQTIRFDSLSTPQVGVINWTNADFRIRGGTGIGLSLGSNNGNDKLIIASSNQVLINKTVANAYALQVNGTTEMTALRVLNGNVIMDNSYIGNAFVMSGTTSLYFYNNNSTTKIRSNNSDITVYFDIPQVSNQTTFVVNDGGGAPTGYKIQKWQTGSVEKAFLDKDGNFATLSTAYVGSIGTINASAILQADSTTKGFLPPRMTNAQMTAIVSPATGLIVYDLTNNRLNVYDGSNWISLH
jgi:hypothetical protein